MKKILPTSHPKSLKGLKYFFLFLPLGLGQIAFAQLGSWSQKASLGTSTTSRSKGPGFELNGYGYVGTGYNGTARNDFWQYDPTADTWTQKANYGGAARYGAVAFSANGFGYIGTGYASAYAKDVWKYDPSGNSWTQVANFSGSARMDAACFVLGTKIFVGTGNDGSVKNDFYEYNSVNDTWTTKANFAGTACCGATGFAVSGKGYICLGRNATSSTYYNTVYQYDSTANSWASKANFAGAAREGAAAFVIGNYAYVGTGGSANLGTLYNDFYKYDPAANSWNAIAGFIGSKRSNTCSFSIGNYGYVGMGYTGTQVNDFYKYDVCGGITLTVTPTSVSCHGGNNGSVTVTAVTGGTSPYSYLWSNNETTSAITNLIAQIDTITITDATGCIKSETVAVTQPAVLAGNITTITNASCNSLCNGKIIIAPSGGTSPYSYSWSPSVSSTSSATGLCAGTYSILITDSKGCTTTKDSTLTAPTALTGNIISIAQTTCAMCNGAFTIDISGGTPSYTYVWSPSVSSTSTATGLCAGNYSVTVSDSKGCTTMNNYILPLNAPIIDSITATPATCPTCPTGNATVYPSGGTPGYTYSWNPSGSTNTITGLAPGTYSVCVTDANGCSVCSSTYVGFATGIFENSLENNISVYPNPSNGKLNVQMSKSENAEIKIYNVLGESIYRHTDTSSTIQIDLNESPSGIYFLQIKNQEGVLTKKIILNH